MDKPMTPPDSGEYLRARTIRNVENPMKPDSGEREVCKHGGPGGDCAVCVAEREYRVSVPLSLAQRILAALESEAVMGEVSPRRLAGLASDLRAAVERKP